MKNYILLLIASLLLCTTCKKGKVEDSQNIEGNHLCISSIMEYLPDAYKNERTLVYKNQAGEIRKLHIAFEEHLTEQTYERQLYTTDSFEGTIYDPAMADFSIVLTGSANFDHGENNSVVKALSVILMPFNESGSLFACIYFEDGQPYIPPITSEDFFRESIELHSQTFQNIFYTTTHQYEVYDELYFNSDVGVVAFRDGEDVLWVFERFE